MTEVTQEARPVDEAPQEAQQADYFGFGDEESYIFPDGITFVTFKVMNEGQRSNYQRLTSRDMVLERKSGDARVGMNQAEERHALILAASVAWNFKKRGNPVPFSERSLKDWLLVANPTHVDALEKAIRKANPWLSADMTVEDIDAEIENLREMRAEKEREVAGE